MSVVCGTDIDLDFLVLKIDASGYPLNSMGDPEYQFEDSVFSARDNVKPQLQMTAKLFVKCIVSDLGHVGVMVLSD
jgi:hypothetical protein